MSYQNNVYKPSISVSSKAKKLSSGASEIIDTILYFSFRLLALIIGCYIGYTLSLKFVPTLEDLCLARTEDCMNIQLYRYKNTFLAQDSVSTTWFWYNGENLFVYGQVPGICRSVGNQTYVPVNTFKVGFDNKEKLVTFSALPNRCIDSHTAIISYYTSTLKVRLETFILKRMSPTSTSNVYQIIQALYNAKVFTFENDK